MKSGEPWWRALEHRKSQAQGREHAGVVRVHLERGRHWRAGGRGEPNRAAARGPGDKDL